MSDYTQLKEQMNEIDDLNARIAELEEKVAYYKKAHTVHKLAEGQDQSAFVFTARLQHVVKEFEGVISTAAAIGAFEVVKHELIAAALEADDEH